MGLRFYRTPEEIDAENEAAAKLERAAARNRSAIRREPTIRNGSIAAFAGANRHRTDSTVQRVRDRVQAVNNARETDAQIEALELELAVLRRERRRAAEAVARRTRLSEEERQLIRYRSNRMTAHEFLTWQPHADDVDTIASTTSSVSLPPPSRESNLRFEVGATQPAGLDVTRPEGMISPPSSADQIDNGRPVDGPIEPWNDNPPLTEGFAPAHAARVAAENAPTQATAEVLRITDENSRPGLETPPPETWEDSHPPLRRVPRMSPQPLPRNAFDGLGDRRTSPGPDEVQESQEEETWNNLMAHMAERREAYRAVSATSSFIAPTVLLDPNVERDPEYRDAEHRDMQQRPSLSQSSSTSFGEIGTSAEDSCDPPPGITAEQVRMIRERHRRTAGGVRSAMRTNRDLREGITEPRSSGGTPAERAWAAVRRVRARQSTDPVRQQEHQRRERELMLDAILLSAETADEIPDEWWALAGMPRISQTRNEL